MLYLLILAGGAGTRLWPLCRNDRPKQFLRFPEEESLLQQAVKRARALVPDDRIFIATRERYAEEILAQVPDFPANHVFLEPYRRDTGPAVAMVVSYLQKYDPSATLAVLTTDHLITDQAAFVQCLRKAATLAEEYEVPVTFGIPPTRPETAFGYLQVGEIVQSTDPRVYRLAAFVEKPDLAKAEEYLAGPNFFWNSGMFVWKNSVAAKLFQQYAPAIWQGVEAITAVDFTAPRFASYYAALPSISVDLAIMEHIETGYVVEATFGWEDIGSWRAFAAVREQDRAGNSTQGQLVALETSGCLFEVPGKLVAAIGLHDLIVVETPDALLICPKGYDQQVKDLLQEVERRGWHQFL